MRAGGDARAEGPPLLSHETGAGPEGEVRTGEPLTLRFTAHNRGGASPGVRVAAWGPAVDRGLVEPLSVRIRVGAEGPETAAGLRREELDGAVLHAADFPGFTIPAGLADPAAAFAHGYDVRSVDRWLSTAVTAAVELRAAAPGRAGLHVGLVPFANPEAGQAAWTFDLRVGPAGPAAGAGG